RRAQAVCVPPPHLHMTAATMQVTPPDFEKAQEQLKLSPPDPGNETKLKLYAPPKQATEGPCPPPKPGMLDFVKKAPPDAWNSLGSLSQKYTELVSSPPPAESAGQKKDAAAPPGRHDGYETIIVTPPNNITKIMFNRPAPPNAINHKMYPPIIKALEEAGKDDPPIAVITDYYSSGNDLPPLANVQPSDMEKMPPHGAVLLREFVDPPPDFPKPLIAVVNAPPIGICVTVLGLCAPPYASDRATSPPPFSQLGQSPEGSPPYLFPKIMGLAKAPPSALYANEMLLFNPPLTAHEACAQGLVPPVFPDWTFQKEVWARLEAYAALPKNTLAVSKQLLRSPPKEKLHEVNSRECPPLRERWLSDECINPPVSFFQKKSKL
ncbi:ECI2 isomerase, partial [Halcyon senegalensis]|nr:ECI2 isomerase [Halcyon senegalensis]